MRAHTPTYVHIHGVACCLVHWTLLDENCSKLRSLRSRISTMLMANSSKKTLSKNLVQMKFMKRRSHDPAASPLVDSVAGALIEKWVVPNIEPVPDENLRHIATEMYTESFVECEELNRFGRFSFNKFNKDVERLSRQYANGGEPSAEFEPDDEDGTIPAREMAKRYLEMASKKLLGKRKSGGCFEEDELEPGEGETSRPALKKRHRELQNRLDKMDKKGFLKPS